MSSSKFGILKRSKAYTVDSFHLLWMIVKGCPGDDMISSVGGLHRYAGHNELVSEL